MKKYLLIIDDMPIEDKFRDYFAKFGFGIAQQSNLSQLDHLSNLPAALLINSTLIHSDLLAINTLYHQYPVPIIVISNYADEELCVRLLEAGADDFIIKPIHPRELHARISAIHRRFCRATQHLDTKKEILAFAGWRLFPGSRQLFNADQELLLSPKEFDLLLAFVRQPQHVLSREFLLQITKTVDSNPLDRRIDVQISRLRQKIEMDAKNPEFIKTVRNGGYMFTAKVSTPKSGTDH